MLRVCLLQQHEGGYFHHDGYIFPSIVSPRYEIKGVKCHSLGHNDALSSSGTEPKVDNLTVANLRFYPPSCIAAGGDDSG